MTALVTYAPPADAPSQKYDVTVAVLGGSIISDVRNGENAGRALHHEFVALHTVESKLKFTDIDSHTATLTIRTEDLPQTPRLALAIWVTHHGEMTPIQATGGWLNCARQ